MDDATILRCPYCSKTMYVRKGLLFYSGKCENKHRLARHIHKEDTITEIVMTDYLITSVVRSMIGSVIDDMTYKKSDENERTCESNGKM